MKITTTHINKYFDENKLIGSGQLPELLFKLINESNQNKVLENIHMPYGDEVKQRDYDGIVKYNDIHPFIPNGESVWEISRQVTWKAKFNKDLNTRSENPLQTDPANTTFVFVTPYTIEEREKNKAIARNENCKIWKNVKIIDATDLQSWLSVSFNTTAWFCELLGIDINHVKTASRWWKDWSNVSYYETSSKTKIPFQLTPDLFFAKNKRLQRVKQQLIQSINNNKYVNLIWDNVNDVNAFAIASFLDEPELFNKTIIIDDLTEFKNILQHIHQNTIIIINFEFELVSEFLEVDNAKIKLINACSKNDVFAKRDSSNTINIPRLEQNDISNFFDVQTQFKPKELPIINNLKSNIRDYGSSLTIMHRLLLGNNQKPEWCNDLENSEKRHYLLTLLIAGQWRITQPDDVQILEKLLDNYNYKSFIVYLERLNTKPDSPLSIIQYPDQSNGLKIVNGKIQNIHHRPLFMIKSLQDYWYLVGFELTNSLLHDITESMLEAFKSKISEEFKTGLLYTLIFLSIPKFTDYNDSDNVNEVIEYLLTQTKPTNQQLKLIGEANPKMLLEHIETNQIMEPDVLATLLPHPDYGKKTIEYLLQQSTNNYEASKRILNNLYNPYLHWSFMPYSDMLDILSQHLKKQDYTDLILYILIQQIPTDQTYSVTIYETWQFKPYETRSEHQSQTTADLTNICDLICDHMYPNLELCQKLLTKLLVTTMDFKEFKQPLLQTIEQQIKNLDADNGKNDFYHYLRNDIERAKGSWKVKDTQLIQALETMQTNIAPDGLNKDLWKFSKNPYSLTNTDVNNADLSHMYNQVEQIITELFKKIYTQNNNDLDKTLKIIFNSEKNPNISGLYVAMFNTIKSPDEAEILLDHFDDTQSNWKKLCHYYIQRSIVIKNKQTGQDEVVGQRFESLYQNNKITNKVKFLQLFSAHIVAFFSQNNPESDINIKTYWETWEYDPFSDILNSQVIDLALKFNNHKPLLLYLKEYHNFSEIPLQIVLNVLNSYYQSINAKTLSMPPDIETALLDIFDKIYKHKELKKFTTCILELEQNYLDLIQAAYADLINERPFPRLTLLKMAKDGNYFGDILQKLNNSHGGMALTFYQILERWVYVISIKRGKDLLDIDTNITNRQRHIHQHPIMIGHDEQATFDINKTKKWIEECSNSAKQYPEQFKQAQYYIVRKLYAMTHHLDDANKNAILNLIDDLEQYHFDPTQTKDDLVGFIKTTDATGTRKIDYGETLKEKHEEYLNLANARKSGIMKDTFNAIAEQFYSDMELEQKLHDQTQDKPRT